MLWVAESLKQHCRRSRSLLPKFSLLEIAKCVGGWELEGEACSPRGPYSEVTYYRVGVMALG